MPYCNDCAKQNKTVEAHRNMGGGVFKCDYHFRLGAAETLSPGARAHVEKVATQIENGHREDRSPANHNGSAAMCFCGRPARHRGMHRGAQIARRKEIPTRERAIVRTLVSGVKTDLPAMPPAVGVRSIEANKMYLLTIAALKHQRSLIDNALAALEALQGNQ